MTYYSDCGWAPFGLTQEVAKGVGKCGVDMTLTDGKCEYNCPLDSSFCSDQTHWDDDTEKCVSTCNPKTPPPTPSVAGHVEMNDFTPPPSPAPARRTTLAARTKAAEEAYTIGDGTCYAKQQFEDLGSYRESNNQTPSDWADKNINRMLAEGFEIKAFDSILYRCDTDSKVCSEVHPRRDVGEQTISDGSDLDKFVKGDKSVDPSPCCFGMVVKNGIWECF